jgi:sulfate adenylyltransferase subunit 1 (EFTu-like GTPase family)
VALAVNKWDLVGWSEPIFDEIETRYRQFAQDLGFETITAIPLSALEGHNVVEPDHTTMAGTTGHSLLEWLENHLDEDRIVAHRLPCRCSGSTVPTSTSVASLGHRQWLSPAGDRVLLARRVLPSRIKRNRRLEWSRGESIAGQSVTLLLRTKSTPAGEMSSRPLHTPWNRLTSSKRIFYG